MIQTISYIYLPTIYLSTFIFKRFIDVLNNSIHGKIFLKIQERPWVRKGLTKLLFRNTRKRLKKCEEFFVFMVLNHNKEF